LVFCFYCAPAGAAQPVCLPAFQAPDHALNQITLKQIYSLLCLCPTRTATPFLPFLGGGSGRSVWSCVVGGRWRRRRRCVVVRFCFRLFNRLAATISNHCAFEVLGLGASAGAGHRLNLLVVFREGVEQLVAKDGRLNAQAVQIWMY
jgi:hypothetical protein